MKKKSGGLYEFFKQTGALDKGSEAMDAARAEYIRLYKREYMREHRKKRKEYRFICTAKEEQLLKAAAKRHNLPESVFVKLAVYAYINQVYIVPDAEALNKIKQAVLKTYSTVCQIEEQELYLRLGKYEGVKVAITDLQAKIHKVFAEPPRIEQVIQEHITATPAFKEILLKLLNDDIKE